MNKEELFYLLNVVEDLNLDWHESLTDVEDIVPWEYSSNGYSEAVSFFGVVVWSSEEDDREYNYEKSEYESWDVYFKRKAEFILNKISAYRSIFLQDSEDKNE